MTLNGEVSLYRILALRGTILSLVDMSYLFCTVGVSRNPEGGETIVGKKAPWHSIKSNVHHNNSNCNTGNNIEAENRRTGTGGKPLCSECKGLN